MDSLSFLYPEGGSHNMNPLSRGKQILLMSLQRNNDQQNQNQLVASLQRHHQNCASIETKNRPVTSTPCHDDKHICDTSLSNFSDLLGSVLNESHEFVNNFSFSAFEDFDSVQQTEEATGEAAVMMETSGKEIIHYEEEGETMDTEGVRLRSFIEENNDGKKTSRPTKENGIVSPTDAQATSEDVGIQPEGGQAKAMLTDNSEIDARDIHESPQLEGTVNGQVGVVNQNQLHVTEVHDARFDTELDRDVEARGGSGDMSNDTVVQVLSKKKRKVADPSKWKKNIKRTRRENGIEYEGRTYHNGSNQFENIIKESRKLDEKCKCKVKKNDCHAITDEERQRVFDEVWTLTWKEKEVFAQAMIDIREIQQKTSADSNRGQSLIYHLKINGQRKRVCKQMFLATTGLKNTWLHQHLLKKTNTFEDSSEGLEVTHRSKHSHHRTFLETFLGSLPKMPSHYCRQSTEKMYLEPTFRSFADLYRVYSERCTEEGMKVMGRTVFMDVFREMNLGLFQPRKDQCDICCSFEAGNVSESDWQLHRLRKEMAQQEKQKDKQLALEQKEKIKIVTMDLQRVLLSPSLQASAMYYKTKLAVHNFTIFDLTTKETICYVWNEAQGGLSGNEFATCIFKHLEKDLSFDKYIIYSDGCTYQNRNSVMSTALRHFARKHEKIVIQKYLEKGHTQMEVDSCHSRIEARLKNRHIFVPYDYVSIIKEARQTPFPYQVEYLDHTYFLNFANFGSLKSIRPGRAVGDPTVTSMKGIRYLPTGVIDFKLDFSHDWSPLPDKRGDHLPDLGESPEQLYNEKLKIAKNKYDHLQQLKSVIPPDYHFFYDNLDH